MFMYFRLSLSPKRCPLPDAWPIALAHTTGHSQQPLSCEDGGNRRLATNDRLTTNHCAWGPSRTPKWPAQGGWTQRSHWSQTFISFILIVDFMSLSWHLEFIWFLYGFQGFPGLGNLNILCPPRWMSSPGRREADRTAVRACHSTPHAWKWNRNFLE